MSNSFQNLKVTLVQNNTIWNAPIQNFGIIEKMLSEHLSSQSTDLIILPEMFQTGFNMKPSESYETMDGPTIHWMRSISSKYNSAIAGSFICQENGNYFNRLAFVTPTFIESVDKRHLFSLAGEHHHYKKGEKRMIIEWRNFRIMPLTCYDLRFPVWSRNDQNYDLLIYVANWPKTRIEHWHALLKARAIENQSIVIGVNRVGEDNNQWQYTGDTAYYFADGSIQAKATEHISDILTVNLSKNDLLNYRNKFNFLNDQDSFSIQELLVN